MLGLLRLLLLCICRDARISGKRQHVTQLAGDATDGIANTGMAECAADRLTERLSDLSEQIAEPALRSELLLLLRLLYLLDIGRSNRIDTEWQYATNLSGDATDIAA